MNKYTYIDGKQSFYEGETYRPKVVFECVAESVLDADILCEKAIKADPKKYLCQVEFNYENSKTNS